MLILICNPNVPHVHSDYKSGSVVESGIAVSIFCQVGFAAGIGVAAAAVRNVCAAGGRQRPEEARMAP